jgi:hypothetical protein
MELRKAGEETAAAKFCVNHQAWRYQQLPETANDAPVCRFCSFCVYWMKSV